MTRAKVVWVAVVVAAVVTLAWSVVSAQPVGVGGISPDAFRDAVRAVERERVVREAVRAADRYLETWNTRDPMAWARSLHFPHVRPGVGPFRLTHTPEDYARGVNFERTIATGWHRSQWDSYDVFQVGPNKAHLAGHYSRYNVDGEPIRTTVITYIVTRQGDHWGIQSRFAAGRADISDARLAESAGAAVGAVEAYVTALNDPIDTAGWAATLNYPHVRVADGTVEMWDTAEDYVNGSQGGRQRAWVETRLDWAEPVQVGGAGVNVAVRFSRLNRQGETLSSYEAVYLVTNRDGHIGIQARSSFAP
ncbi:MAG: hypothetical protein CL477_02255 [Acidobacteria bacterium]|jgi:hypothetical protein|nr:hypothetical protein [Acidobacteriota bacterium]MDP7337821.1 hypothetical protein [Vicinamibacterales bacterium]MDP7480603.1 hypothetical protein [Vicinamibacterales bacterium]MDP7691927.1 hypothetical protein [Vicinamibacterales bacterium]HJN42896.1 hypothetical protein [Vicinamibacterales bacterium]|tara:strand:+ start:2041 stop:2958 length:918 start_codon:yes stop_codon:yes gene_type:complete